MFRTSRRPHDAAGSHRPSRSFRVAAVAALTATLTALTLVPIAFAQNVRVWSPAVSVDPGRLNGVNTSVNDGCPMEGPDGHVLFLASNRVPGAPGTKDLDIWVAYRATEHHPWNLPEPLPPPVNSGAAEFCPTPLPGNQLLFVSTRANDCGGGNDADIYFSHLRMWPLGWADPVALPCDDVHGINSRFEEFSPSLVRAEGRTFLFFSTNRQTQAAGVHDIYSSELLPDGTWSPAHPVDALNSPGFSSARPNVRADGLEIVFDSNREGTYDIYVAVRESLTAEWSSPKRLTSAVNSDTADETRPSLSRDGTRLYFGSTRANAELGGSGGDIYVSTRKGKAPRK